MHPPPPAGAGGGVPAAGLPVVRLLRDDHDRLVVAPPAAAPDRPDPGPPFDPFPLPPLPLSLHCWLTGLAAEFHRRHKRCLAALLLIDCRQRRWVRPLVPVQACGRDGASWTLDPGDAPRPAPDRRVAGSFQTREARDLFDASSSVPPLDGLHVVQAVTPSQPSATLVFTFLHSDRQTSIVPPDDVMNDDWEEALTEASGRMTFD